jgi:hypothetical protein
MNCLDPTMEITSFLQRLPGGKALNSAKDTLLSQGAKARLNPLLRKYGTMLDLKLNTAEHSLSVSLHLKGEESPININVREYSLISKDGRTFVEIDGGNIETSREWLTTLIQDQLGRRSFPVPENLARFIPLLT